MTEANQYKTRRAWFTNGSFESHRYNKRKVIKMTQQTPFKQREFCELFVLVVKCFRLFGLCPVKISYIRGRPKIELNRLLAAIVIFVLISIWAALIGSFFVNYNTPLIPGIANHIQFITGVLAVSVTLVVPIFKCTELNQILEDFIAIDEQLNYFNMNFYNAKLKSTFWRFFTAYILFLSISGLYDGYVMLILEHDTPYWLWFYHLIPFMLYSLAFMMAFTMIKWVKIRIRLLNRLIEQYYVNPALNNLKISCIVVMDLGDRKGNVFKNTEELHLCNRILPIVSKTIDLATRLESYNGPLFLFGYLALFCVSTIQVYYCYLYVTLAKHDGSFSINSFAISLVIILENLMAIYGLPYICEAVTNESKTLMSYLSKLSIKHGQNVKSSVWFPCLISRIKFSAMGFFDINYNMLCGFSAGLITYLIIFIQFSSITFESDGSRMTVRKL
uniref:gustatory receptor 48 n=1 Tax=Aedes aegypti TaxID=7159 RepID=UPI000C23F602|nr:gustatory receptor 48 [Aedes aegypti]